MAGCGAPQCMCRRSVYPVNNGCGGRSRVMVGVEIVMTSGGTGCRREQECMILLISSSVRDSSSGSAGTIRGRSIQMVMLVANLLMWNHQRVGRQRVTIAG